MTEKKLKVLIVDDSVVFRNVLSEIVTRNCRCELLKSFGEGREALEYIENNNVDFVLLDIELPGLNGVQVLEQINQINEKQFRNPPVEAIMVSHLSTPGAEITIKALETGAFDFVPKPEGTYLPKNIEILKAELYDKIEALYNKRFPVSRALNSEKRIFRKTLSGKHRIAEFKAIVVGASTGGPKAVMTIIPPLSRMINLPMIIAIHTPPIFSGLFAENLSRRVSNYNVIESIDNGIVENNTIYIAQGGKNLLLKRSSDGKVRTSMNTLPSEEKAFPSVNALFRSAATAFDGPVIALILTGMGIDGTKGLSSLKRNGGYIIAQDEKTSIVWGMPGSAVASGIVDTVLSLGDIPAEILRRVKENSGF
ncbi:MAG: chemotaxis-specific protein-glutamate methyltransferase CheB [Candidatus Riflebacteria bacterium]|nr:chemotaxis-specific protein-glutamate methyltransferase CheB [Candidatus Riflebacteria bacterium]